VRLKLSLIWMTLAFSLVAFGSSRSQRERGAAAFTTNGCPYCHTIHNQGGHKGPDLSGVGRILTETQIRTQIAHGGKGMPPFGDVLKPDEVNDLVAYLRSCREKPKK